MVNWFCSSSLCFNSYRSKDKEGRSLKYYRLPSDESTQRKYETFFKTTGFNWKYGHICCEHWSSGGRNSPSEMPDVLLTQEMYDLIKLKHIRAKKKYNSAKNPTPKQRASFLKAKKKLRTATSIIQASSSISIPSTRVPQKEDY